MTHNIQLHRLRPVVKEAIAALQLPPLIEVESNLWRQHVSYRGASHWRFELPAGDVVTDYERLEVRKPAASDRDCSSARESSGLASVAPQHVGDALVGAEAALLIHERYPRLTVGVRTLLKYALVENITLAQIARAFDMPGDILTSAAQASSMQNNEGVQACVFEAYTAVLYEERGGDELRRFLRKIYEPLLPTLVNALRAIYGQYEDVNNLNPSSTNYVGKLHEWCMEKQTPGRRVEFSMPERSGGPSHAPLWQVRCTVSRLADALESVTFESVAGSVAKAKNA